MRCLMSSKCERRKHVDGDKQCVSSKTFRAAHVAAGSESVGLTPQIVMSHVLFVLSSRLNISSMMPLCKTNIEKMLQNMIGTPHPLPGILKLSLGF